MIMKTLVLLLAVTWSALAELERKCPPKEAISCSCIMRLGAVLHCSNMGNLEKLQSTLKQLQGYYIDTLTLHETKVSSFPVDLFYGLHIERLVLINFDVEDASFRPGRLHFHGLENSLHTLEIQKSFRGERSLLNLKLDHMKALQTVIFEHNGIPEVGNDWFTEGPSSLKTLIFEGNRIEKLGDKAFQKLVNLEFLAVADSHLRDLSRSMFPSPANKLDFLELSYNKIRELPKDIFSNMPSLTSILLDHNLINILKEDTWSTVLRQLKQLSLEENLLECDDKLKWVCNSKPGVISSHCVAPADKKGMKISKFCGV